MAQGFITRRGGSAPTAPPVLIFNTPAQIGTLSYNGNPQSPVWENYDSSQLTLGGVMVSTNAGTFTATFTPNAGHFWSDGTNTPRDVTWTIEQVAGSLSVSPESVTLNAENTSAAVMVTKLGGGTIRAVSSDTSIATVSLSGNTLTINSVDDTSGNVTVTVNVAQGTNHLAPLDQIVTVNAEFIPPVLPVFGENTWEQISAASAIIETSVPAYDGTNGVAVANAVRDLFGWNVGDTKAIIMNGTSYNLRILGFNHDNKHVSLGGGKAGISLELGPVCYGTTTSDRRQMNTGASNLGGWMTSHMRSTVLNIDGSNIGSFLPADLIAVIKLITKPTSAGSQSSTISLTSNNLWLLSEIEVIGDVVRSRVGEGMQYAFWTANNTGALRSKQQPSGTPYAWWLRSPYASNNTHFCAISISGGSGWQEAALANGVSFGLCV